jgi:DNA polymerase-3 subunit delta
VGKGDGWIMSQVILARHLKKGALKPVYLFCGEEEFLLQRALGQVEAYLRERGELSAKVSFRLHEVSWAEVLSAARSPQLWGGRQLVVVWGVERSKAAELKPLAAYLQAPSAWTCLVLVAAALKMKEVQSHALWRQLLEQEAVVAFPRLWERELIQWLEEEAKRQGKTLAPGVARFLVEMGGQNLSELAQQLEKLILFVGAAPELSLAAARTLASQSRQYTIFELVEALGQSRPEKALQVLHQLLELGEPPGVILVMLARQIRLLWRVAAKPPEGRDADTLARELGLPPFAAAKLLQQAKHFRPGRLREQLLALQEVDLQLKSGALAPPLSLEKVILDLCPLPELRERRPGR